MSIPAAQFPTKVWDGATATRSAEGLMEHIAPSAEDFEQLVQEIQGIQELLRTFALANMTLGFKFYVGDGVNSSGGDVQATFTGTVIGERVLAVIGQTKAADGNAQAALNSFSKLAVGTDCEATITATNKIVFKNGLADKSAITYFAICAPAAATAIAVQ